MKLPRVLVWALVLAAAVALVAAGCARPAPQAQPPEVKEEGPERGGTFFSASIGDASTFNPILVNDTASSQISGKLFDSLISFDDKVNIIPELAEKWESSPDGLTWTFTLRPGLRWHDGTPLTTRDVKFTFESILHPFYTGVRVANYTSLAGVKEYRAELTGLNNQLKEKAITEAEHQEKSLAAFEAWKAQNALEIVDDRVIKLHLAETYAPFLPQAMGMGIIPEHLLKDVQGKAMADAEFNRKPVGNGAWKFKEWKTGEYVAIVANDDYWDGRPNVDEYVMKIIPDQNTVMVALEAREVDLGGVTPEEYDRFAQLKHLNLHEYPIFSYTYLGYNLTNPLFAQKEVRQAIAHAVNKEVLIDELLQGHGTVAWTHGSPARWDYNPDVKTYPYDPEKAKQMLDAAGWKVNPATGIREKDGKPFAFKLQTNQGNKQREAAAVVIQENLEAVGIKVEVELVEWSTFVNTVLLPKNFEAIIVGWSLGVDPDAFSIWHSKGGPFNFVSYENARVDELLEQGRKELDLDKRAAIYREIWAILAEDQPYLFLYYPNSIVAVNKRVLGPIGGTPVGIEWNIEDWWIPTKWQAGPAAWTEG